jgi:hypothetical protein
MRPILILLLFFQFSVSAQTNTKNLDVSKKLYFTLINGKSNASLKLTRNEIIDASITLKGKEDYETIPEIKALEMYIPGYPEIYVEGNVIDRETASKIEKAKAGDVIVVKPKTEIDSRIATMTIEIIE